MLTFAHACPSEAGSGASFVFMTVKIPSKSGFSKAKVLKRQGVQSSFKILSNSKCDFHLFAQNCYVSIFVTVGNFFWYQQTAVQASGMLLQEPVAPSRWVPPVTVNRMSRPCHSPTGYDNQKPVGLSDMVAHRGEHQHRKAKYQSRLGIEPPGGWSGRSLPSRNLWKRLWTPFVILVRSNTQISRQASHQFPLKKKTKRNGVEKIKALKWYWKLASRKCHCFQFPNANNAVELHCMTSVSKMLMDLFKPFETEKSKKTNTQKKVYNSLKISRPVAGETP